MKIARALLAVLSVAACGSSIDGEQLSTGGGTFGTSTSGTPAGGGSGTPGTPNDETTNPNTGSSVCADAGICSAGECCGGTCCAIGQMCCNSRCLMPTLDMPSCLTSP